MIRVILFLLLSFNLYSATEFICRINNGGHAGTVEDYGTIALWENAVDNAGDITAADCKVFSHGGITGTIADGAAVTGVTSGATATVIHATGNQLLLDAIAISNFQAGEVVRVSAGNEVTISNAGDSVILVAELHSDDGIMTNSSSMYINGTTCGASNYIHIRAAAGEKFTDLSETTGVILNGTSTTDCTIALYSAYIRFSDIMVLQTATTGTNTRAIIVAGNNIKIEKCAIRSNLSRGIIVSAGANQIYQNNWIYNCGSQGISLGISLAYTVYNNTVYNCVIGYEVGVSGPNVIVKNNVGLNNSTSDFNSTIMACTFQNNISSDATGNIPNQTLETTFVSTTDYTPIAGSAAIDRGQNLSSIFTTDIFGRTFGVWDIGAVEYQHPAITNLIRTKNLLKHYKTSGSAVYES